MTGTDMRSNTQSDQGVSYYVTSSGDRVAGPFGSKEYARTVSDRMEDKQGYQNTSLMGEMA